MHSLWRAKYQFPKIIIIGLPCDSNFPLLNVCSRELKIYVQTSYSNVIQIIIVALFIMAKSENNWNVYQEINGKTNTTKGYLVTKRNEVLIHDTNMDESHKIYANFQKPDTRDYIFSSVQFSSVTQSSPTLCDPMDCSMPGLPVYHQLLELT